MDEYKEIKDMKDLMEQLDQKATKLAFQYCEHIVKAAPGEPLTVMDLQRAFIAGFHAGTMSPINLDDLETALKKVEEKIVAVFGN